MLQLAWLFNFLPLGFMHWLASTLIIFGVVGLIASMFVWKFSSIAPYKLLIQIVSIVMLLTGTYLKGGYAVEAEWQAKVKALEAKVAVAEEKSKTANAEIKIVYVDKVRTVKEIKYKTKTRIVEVAKEIDQKCEVDPKAIEILNLSAQSKETK